MRKYTRHELEAGLKTGRYQGTREGRILLGWSGPVWGEEQPPSPKFVTVEEALEILNGPQGDDWGPQGQ